MNVSHPDPARDAYLPHNTKINRGFFSELRSRRPPGIKPNRHFVFFFFNWQCVFLFFSLHYSSHFMGEKSSLRRGRVCPRSQSRDLISVFLISECASPPPSGLVPGAPPGGGHRCRGHAAARGFTRLVQHPRPAQTPLTHEGTETRTGQSDTVHVVIGQSRHIKLTSTVSCLFLADISNFISHGKMVSCGPHRRPPQAAD